MATSFSSAQLSSFIMHPAERVMVQVGRAFGVTLTTASDEVDTPSASMPTTHETTASVTQNHAATMSTGEREDSLPKLTETRSKVGSSPQTTFGSVTSTDPVAPTVVTQRSTSKREEPTAPRRPKIRIVPQTPSTAAVAPHVPNDAPSTSLPPGRKQPSFVVPNEPSSNFDTPALARSSAGPHSLLATFERAPQALSPVGLDTRRIPDEPRQAHNNPKRKQLVFAVPNEPSPKIDAQHSARPSTDPHAVPGTAERAQQNSSPKSNDAPPANAASQPRRPRIRVLSAAQVVEPAMSPQPAATPSPADRKQLRFAPPANATLPTLDIPLAPATTTRSVPATHANDLPTTSRSAPSSGADQRSQATAPPASSADTTVATTPNATASPATDTDHAGTRPTSTGRIARHVFEDLLVDVLRDAARRHGLEV